MIPHHVANFSLKNISAKMSDINTHIGQLNNKPFPNPNLLSNYQYQQRPIHFNDHGNIKGGYCRLITSLIDFSFIRSLVADTYSPEAPPCYDPVSLFLLDLFRYIDEYSDLNDFLTNTLPDKDKGNAYRLYAGISEDQIPCDATFSNFRARLGEDLYNQIFHTLVEIFYLLNLITFNILSIDGTLYHTRARYRGCCHFCPSCETLNCKDAIPKVKEKITSRLNDMANGNFGKEIRVSIDCPNCKDEDKKPKVELFTFRLSFKNQNPTQAQLNTEKLFQVEQDLEKQGLLLNTLRSNVTSIDYNTGTLTIKCPKLPKDMEAKVGVRRNPQNPDKTEKIFGYNAIITTSIEPHLGLELPVACSNIAGNAEEGKYLIRNRDQISIYHPQAKVQLDIADSKYDELNNFAYCREHGSIPIIDYNPRNEDLSKKTLKNRGFDEHGTPFAPCGVLTRFNGFDQKTNSLIYCCHHQCSTLRAKGIKMLQESLDKAPCPHAKKSCGFTRHMSIQEYPRLCVEIPRGSERHTKIKAMRTASERINSSAKADLSMLDHPKVMGSLRSAVLAQMTCIVILLKRVFSFIVKVTLFTMKEESEPYQTDQIPFPNEVPAYLKNHFFLE